MDHAQLTLLISAISRKSAAWTGDLVYEIQRGAVGMSDVSWVARRFREDIQGQLDQIAAIAESPEPPA